MTKDQATKGIKVLISVLLFAVTLAVIFNSQLGILKWITNYSVQIMLGMLGLGLIFFTMAQERLMFTSFICCSLICLFLQRSANENLVLPEYSAGSVFKIAHANLTNVTGDIDEAIGMILESSPDLISLQEVNFPLNERITSLLEDQYPYQSSPMKKNDFWSINVYAKSPIENMDTFYFGDIPNLEGEVFLDNDEHPIRFVSTYILPPLSESLGNFQGHLDRLANSRRSMTAPYVIFGDFNVAGWYDEIQDFRETIQVMDSRRGYMPAVSNLFSYPVDHIFFSKQLKCVGFDVLKTDNAEIGIIGSYQLNENFLSDL